MAEKVTTMVLKVDLQCPSCYRKIKKVLAKFPQIRSQAYDEKQNTVTINLVCCSPEKIRDMLCCNGGKTIKSIEIKPPPTPKKTPPDPVNQNKPPVPTPLPPAPVHPPPTPVYVPVPVCCWQCYAGIPGGPCYKGYGGNRACYGVSCCVEHFIEENTSGCTIM
ncbi:hypothetical protein RHSIM_RhsimUnG0175400 [Rhododendron simsii]|uniref:HMA domain-containing protein n=1 Tax=Rhododendron simsii TaxID=118357 RepID=A0A834L3U6_RHOSS|nr:hypothetical protein RHSIM_RhsimUnG0175400 [Rhododendron simsii]